jgi:hypothetical protein
MKDSQYPRHARVFIAALLAVGCDRFGSPAPSADEIAAVRTTTFAEAPTGYSDWEPAIVADPDNRDHVAVSSALFFDRGADTSAKRELQSTRAWVSNDGGKTWGAPQSILTEVLPGEKLLNGDPAFAVRPDGRLSLAILAGPLAAPPKPTFYGLIVATQTKPGGPFDQYAKLPLNDVPRAWSMSHVPAISIDRWKESPYFGRTYLTASPPMGEGAGNDWKVQEGWSLMFWRSTDSGKTYSQAKEIPNTRNPIEVQAAVGAVRPDGSLHMLYSKNDSAQIRYLVSRDGGETFQPSQLLYTGRPSHWIVRKKNSRPDTMRWELQWPRMAIGETGKNRGAMLGTWSEGYSRTEEPNHPDEEIFVIVNRDGNLWSKPAPLDSTLKSGEQLGYAVPAVTSDAMWILAYRADTSKTQVVLYRSTDQGASWGIARVLDERPFGTTMLLTQTDVDPPESARTVSWAPGHYVSLSAAGNRLYAAYTFPMNNNAKGKSLIFVSAIDLQ